MSKIGALMDEEEPQKYSAEQAGTLIVSLAQELQASFTGPQVQADSTNVGDLEPDQEFAFIIYIVFAVICLATFIVLLYITLKVVKLVGASDKIIPAMLVCLQLSAISKCSPVAHRSIFGRLRNIFL